MQILKDKIKSAITDAAREEFRKQGFQKASVRDISENSNISTSNMYNYFKNKEDLFCEVVNPVYTGLKDYIQSRGQYSKCENKDKKHNEMNEKIKEIAEPLKDLVAKYNKEIYILFEKSKGTQYEKSKEEMISFIEKKLVFEIAKKHDVEHLEKDDAAFVMKVIGANLVEATIKISKHYKNRKWMERNIDMYLYYHLAGVMNFMRYAKTD